MLDPIVLQGRHVRLEPLALGQAEELAHVAFDEDTWRYMGARVADQPALERWMRARLADVERGTALAFLQRDATSGRAIGSTSLFDVDLQHRRMEVGHTWVAPSHRRTGVNTEAKLLLLTHAFETLVANRVQIKTDVDNLRSRAAIERLGAQREGILRRFSVYEDGSVHDRVLYSVVREEWPAVRARLQGLLAR